MSGETRDMGARVRTILDGLILAGVIWLASSVQAQREATVRLQTQLVAQTDEIRSLRSQLSDVPQITTDLAGMRAHDAEQDRRLERLESFHFPASRAVQ